MTATPVTAWDAGLLLWLLLAAVWLWRQPPGTPLSHRLYPLAPLAVAALAWGLAPAWAWLGVWAQVAVFLWAGLTITWLISVAKHDASLMDIAYGLLLLGVPWWVVTVAGQGGGTASGLVLSCATLGFGRYAVYVLWRNLPHGEDPRYARWRQRHGAGWWWWSYFQVFLLQGVVMALWCLPLVLALVAAHGQALGPWQLLGALVWAVGFVFEAGGDWQLARFKRQRRDRTQLLDSGLWAFTRHPNYFGQTAMWWGYGVMALAHPQGWLALLALAHVTWFMHRGSATSLMERHMMKTKPGYADYCARVPAFFPRWPGRRAPVPKETSLS